MHKNKTSLGPIKRIYSNETLSFPSLITQSDILDLIDLLDVYLLIYHLILIYKFFLYIYIYIYLFTNFIYIYIYIYNSRNRGYLNIEHLKAIIDKTKRIKEEISKHELKKKRSKYLMKWRPFTDDLV